MRFNKLATGQRDWLVAHYPTMTNRELADAAHEMWGVEISTKQLANFAKRTGLHKTRETYNRAISLSLGGMTSEQQDFMRAFAPHHSWREISAEYERRWGRALKKSDVFNMMHHLGLRSEIPNRGQFVSGHTPWTKGKSWDDYMSPEGMRRIREGGNLFRKGECNAYSESRRRRLLDTYRTPRGDDLRIYVDPRNARTPSQRWISYARFVWMRANGRDWPEGCHAVFADHDRDNFDPDNIVPVPLELVPYVCSGGHGNALPYHDRESLELSMAHARLVAARAKAEKALKERAA